MKKISHEGGKILVWSIFTRVRAVMSGTSRSIVCVRGTPLVDPFHHTRIIEVPTIIPRRSVIEEGAVLPPLHPTRHVIFSSDHDFRLLLHLPRRQLKKTSLQTT